MLYTQNIQSCFFETIGTAGVTSALYEDYLARCDTALQTVLRRHQAGDLPFLDLPDRRDDLAVLTGIADRFRHGCSDVMILGTGGSILGGQALCALSPGTIQGYGIPGSDGPRLWFMDNIDPDGFATLFGCLQPQRTGVLAISKSGHTMETLCQFLAVRDWMGPGNDLAERGVAICEPGPRPLRDLATAAGMTILDHDPAISGRYAVLSLVGLLPAMIVGLDAEAFRRGAAVTLHQTLHAARQADLKAAFPVEAAALSAALIDTQQATICVLMPYMDRLENVSLWHRQLWAESLGKDGYGMTPAPARGTVDQHSQLQLYLDGPNDKFLTVITGDPVARGPVMPAGPGVPDYLAGRCMADVLSAESKATYEYLVEKKRPTRSITIQVLNEETLGALLMHFMLETVLTATIIGVNPFDQPAVEKGKALARSHLAALDDPVKDRTI